MAISSDACVSPANRARSAAAASSDAICHAGLPKVGLLNDDPKSSIVAAQTVQQHFQNHR